MDPTPESIAFADYFIQNIVFVGNAGYDLYLDENMVYINGIEQRQIVILAYEGGGYNCRDCLWNSTHSGGFWFKSFWVIDGDYPKGSFRIYYDD